MTVQQALIELAVAKGAEHTTDAPGNAVLTGLQDEIDTKTAKEGDTFHGTVAANVFRNGYPLIPVDTPVLGRIVEAKPAARFVGFALLTVELVSLRLPTPGGEDENVPS